MAKKDIDEQYLPKLKTKSVSIYDFLNMDFFKSTVGIGPTLYKGKSDGEQYVIEITFEKGESETYISKYQPKLTSWMNMLGFSGSNCESDTVRWLKALMEDLKELSESSYADYERISEKILTSYTQLVYHNDFGLMYFWDIYSILHTCYELSPNEPLEKYAKENISGLVKKIMMVITSVPSMRNYVLQAIEEPFVNGFVRKPALYFQYYNARLSKEGRVNPYAEALYYGNDHKLPTKTEYKFQSNTSEEYLLDNETNNLVIQNDYTFNQLFVSGIDYLIETDSIIKKCPLCKHYFVCKYTAITTYCTRIYKGKATCQMYISQENYRKKKSEDAIYKEFNRVYRRLDSRIRRGTMTREEAKIDDLYKLRDEYMTRYDKAKTPEEAEAIANSFGARAEIMWGQL